MSNYGHAVTYNKCYAGMDALFHIACLDTQGVLACHCPSYHIFVIPMP